VSHLPVPVAVQQGIWDALASVLLGAMALVSQDFWLAYRVVSSYTALYADEETD
jgi:hypothetical protein